MISDEARPPRAWRPKGCRFQQRGGLSALLPAAGAPQSTGEQALTVHVGQPQPPRGGSVINKKIHIPKIPMPQISIFMSLRSVVSDRKWNWSGCPPGEEQPCELGPPPVGAVPIPTAPPLSPLRVSPPLAGANPSQSPLTGSRRRGIN